MTNALHPVRKAVFPVAGLGTRFLPATKASPKEMLAVVDKPLIQYAVEEAVAAGVTDLIFVTGRHKRAIEDHFDAAPELEAELHQKGKHQLLEQVRHLLPRHVNCIFVRQPQALGLGHAVLCAAPVVGHEPFAVLLADDLMTTPLGTPSVTAQLVTAYAQTGGSVLAVQDVPREQTGSYGIVSLANGAAGAAPQPANSSVHQPAERISGIVEKPAPAVAPSTLAVAGRYVLTADIFERLRHTPRGAGGEIQLTDGIAQQVASASGVFALPYQGRRYDCGSKLGLLQATVDLGQQHAEVGAAFSEWLAKRG